jgi:hypothetical protein
MNNQSDERLRSPDTWFRSHTWLNNWKKHLDLLFQSSPWVIMQLLPQFSTPFNCLFIMQKWTWWTTTTRMDIHGWVTQISNHFTNLWQSTHHWLLHVKVRWLKNCKNQLFYGCWRYELIAQTTTRDHIILSAHMPMPGLASPPHGKCKWYQGKQRGSPAQVYFLHNIPAIFDGGEAG